MQVSVPIVSNDKCKNMFLAAGRHEVSHIETGRFEAEGFETGHLVGEPLRYSYLCLSSYSVKLGHIWK